MACLQTLQNAWELLWYYELWTYGCLLATLRWWLSRYFSESFKETFFLSDVALGRIFLKGPLPIPYWGLFEGANHFCRKGLSFPLKYPWVLSSSCFIEKNRQCCQMLCLYTRLETTTEVAYIIMDWHDISSCLHNICIDKSSNHVDIAMWRGPLRVFV